MAEKLDVIITERPGLYSIDNFESLKETLQEYTRQYIGAQFDCEDKESRKLAKDICADLRKMKATIEDKRKEIKKSCLEPYNVLEKKCKELTAMIDKTTDGIGQQLNAYEAERQARKREQIEKAFNTLVSGKLEGYVTLDEIFDKKWLNATVTIGSITEVMSLTLATYTDQLETIRKMPEDVQQAVLPIWKATKDMTAVTGKVAEYNEQKARILEAERERQAAAERAKIEEEVRKSVKQEQQLEDLKQKATDLNDGYMEIPDFGDVPENDLKTVWFRVTGNPDELDQLRLCLNSMGLPFEEKEV